MSKRDYYEILGVAKSATEPELKKAYRRLARQHHPDVSTDPDSETIFKEISEAYSVLSDPQNRARYDQFGHAGLDGAGGGGFGGFEGFGFGDIFDAFFGRGGNPFSQSGGAGGRQRGPERGSDLRIDLEVPFGEAIFGGEKEIQIQHLENCSSCEGSGAEKGTEIDSCPMCRGSGQIQQHQRTAFGTFTHITTCPKCHGEGRFATNPCKTCKGQGREKVKKKLKVKIPAGVDTGVRLCVNGEGDSGVHGGPAGDLYIVLHALKDPDNIFERQEFNLYTTISISYPQAVLGDEIQIPTLEGPTNHKIPEGTQPGTLFKLKNKGVPILGGQGRGDLLVEVTIDVPKKVSGEEHKYLVELFDLHKKKEEPKSFSFKEGGGIAEQADNDEEKSSSFFDVLKNTWKTHKER